MKQARAGIALGLVVGGIVGVAIGTAGRDTSTVVADESATREEPRSRGGGPMPRGAERGHVEPAARSAARPTAEAPEAPAAVVTRPADEILRDLEAALRSDEPLDDTHHALVAELKRSGVDVRDLALVDLALARSRDTNDLAFKIAHRLAGLVAPDVAFNTLARAFEGDGANRLDVVRNLAGQAVRSARDTTALAARALEHSDPVVREAGIQLAVSGESPHVYTLIQVAQRDADDSVRSHAIQVLMRSLDGDAVDERTREAVTPIVLLAAREGGLEARREAISWLPSLGPVAADTALEIVREGGLDKQLLRCAVAPVLAAGRFEELMAIDDSSRVVSAAGWWLDANQPEGDELRALFPLIHAVLRLDDEDLTFPALARIGWGGELDELERIAGDRTLPGRARAMATALLFAKELESERLDEAEPHGLRALRGLLQPGAADATTRRNAIGAFTEWFATLEDASVRSDVLALLRRTARGDPNAWVRDEAAEALEYLEDQAE